MTEKQTLTLPAPDLEGQLIALKRRVATLEAVVEVLAATPGVNTYQRVRDMLAASNNAPLYGATDAPTA